MEPPDLGAASAEGVQRLASGLGQQRGSGDGAGNLETTASQDEYAFPTKVVGTLQAAFFGVFKLALGYLVTWKLVHDQSGSTVFSNDRLLVHEDLCEEWPQRFE